MHLCAGYGELKLRARILCLTDTAPRLSPAPRLDPRSYSPAEALMDWLQVGLASRLSTARAFACVTLACVQEAMGSNLLRVGGFIPC